MIGQRGEDNAVYYGYARDVARLLNDGDVKAGRGFQDGKQSLFGWIQDLCFWQFL